MPAKRMSDSEWECLTASVTGAPSTESDLLMAEYLDGERIEWCFEPEFPGVSEHPDFVVRVRDVPVIIEVKTPEPKSSPQVAGHFDPYRGIRKQIEKARQKFREFKDYCCNVVISNRGDSKTLLDAEHVFGAMLGNLGFTFPILDNDDCHRLETIQNVFLPKGGKMVRYAPREYQNTTIAAVIGLEEVTIRNREFESVKYEAIQEEQRRRGRELSPKECAVVGCRVVTEFVEAGHGPIDHRVPRVIVCENPGARLPLSRDVLCGRFDERWAIVDESLSPVYAGVRVGDIEDSLISEELCLQRH